jgi:hypothetical protein
LALRERAQRERARSARGGGQGCDRRRRDRDDEYKKTNVKGKKRETLDSVVVFIV